MPKFTELPGASPPGPPSGLCPGPAGGLTAPPRPQLFFWSLWPRHYQNASDGPGAYLLAFSSFVYEFIIPKLKASGKRKRSKDC